MSGPQRKREKHLPSLHSATKGAFDSLIVPITPTAQIITQTTNLTSSIEQAQIAGARYLAGRGFVGRLQFL